MGRPFTSHDGTDARGIRAEVVVEDHTGVIKAISEMDKVAKIEFAGDNLTKPVIGYLQLDDPLLDTIKELKKSKETVNYRIEITRKEGVDRSVSMSELRSSAETAQASVRKILAGINGVLSKEAVTNPAEDPDAGGLYKATDGDMRQGNSGGNASNGNSASNSTEILINAVKAGLPHEALSALVATAIYNGADAAEIIAIAYPDEVAPTHVPHHVRSREAAVFRKWNDDGTMNLGSSQVISGVSSENFSRRLLSPLKDTEGFDAIVERYATIVLAVADTIQLNAYNNIGSPDRMAGSHTRIRGVVYDVIESQYPFPALTEGLNNEADLAWVANVGRVAKERFFASIRIAHSEFSFNSLRPETKNEAVAEKASTEEATAPVAKVEKPITVTKEPAKKEPVAKKAPTVQDAPKVEEVATVVDNENNVGNEEDEDNFDFELYDFVEVPEENTQVPAPKTINSLKNLFVEFKVDQADFFKLGDLLDYSFGKRQAKDVPSPELVKFIEFYKEQGAENLHKALNNVESILNG